MKNIETHIAKDKEILQDPTISPQQRRHIEEELKELEYYRKENPADLHDPSPLELYCAMNPETEECRVYED